MNNSKIIPSLGKYGFVFMVILFSCVNTINAQPELIGTIYTDFRLTNIIKNDMNYVSGTYIVNNDVTGDDIVIVELDIYGTVLFEKEIKLERNQYCTMLKKIDEHDYILSVYDTDYFDSYIVITNNDGSNVIKLYLEEYDAYYVEDILVYDKEDYYRMVSFSNETGSFVLLDRFNSKGVTWHKILPYGGYERNELLKISDGNIIFNYNNTLFKLNHVDNTIEEYFKSDTKNRIYIADFIELSNGDILIFYKDERATNFDYIPYFIKISLDGDISWIKSFDEKEYEFRYWGLQNYYLVETVEGGFIFTILSYDWRTIKVSNTGVVEWYLDETNFVFQDDQGYYVSDSYYKIDLYSPDYPFLTITSSFGETNGEGRYKINSEVTIEINPEYIETELHRTTFVGWETQSQNGYSGLENPTSFTLLNPVTETALWEEEYYVEFNIENGQLNRQSGWFENDEFINLIATPDDGYEFYGWDILPQQSTNIEENVLTVQISESLTISAIIRKNERTLTIVSPYGTSSGEGTYPTGEIVTFGISPSIVEENSRYTFLSWLSLDEFGYDGSENSMIITLNDDVTQYAQWKIEHFVDLSSETGGSISDYSGWYEEGSKVTITATPDSGYLFNGWKDENTNSTFSDDTLKMEVTKPLRLEANFVKENSGIPGFSVSSIILGLSIHFVLFRRYQLSR